MRPLSNIKSTMFTFMVVGLLLIGDTGAFTTPQQGRLSLKLMEGFLGGFIKNLFEDDPAPAPPSPSFFVQPNSNTPFEATPEGLITRAKIFLASDMGALDGGSLIDEDFVWIGATSNGNVLGKAEYLAAAKFFELRTAFPDLDKRAHDFRMDEVDPLTVRLTARTVGNMRGALRLRNEVVQPNGRQMVCPPEAISITFDDSTGKVIRLCSGFVMDRLVGNTGGLCGVMAAATVAGSPPSDWEVYPIPTVLGRFFGRPTRPIMEPKSYLAPFPESVMIQLSKGILASEMATLDPDVLSSSFTFCGPYVGPIPKSDFLANCAADMFGGAEPDFSHFRVDPYDPYRVWVDVRSTGTFEDGDSFETPPQAMSFTFDDNGFCTRITGDAVMDPTLGNTGGLGGIEGINYAAGSPSLEFLTRPVPQVLGRLRKTVLSPISKIGVDDYLPPGTVVTEESLMPKPPAENPPLSPLEKLGAFANLPKVEASKPPKLTQEQKKAKVIAEAKAKKGEIARKAQEAAMARKAAAGEKKAEQEASRLAKVETSRQSAVTRAEEKKKNAEGFFTARKATAEEAKAKKEAAQSAKSQATSIKSEQVASFARNFAMGESQSVQKAGKAAQSKVKAAVEMKRKIEETAKKASVEAAKKVEAQKKAIAEAKKRASSQKMNASTAAFKKSKKDDVQAERLVVAAEKKKKAEQIAVAKQAKQEEALAKKEASTTKAKREADKQAKLNEAQAKKATLEDGMVAKQEVKAQREVEKQAKLEGAKEAKKMKAQKAAEAKKAVAEEKRLQMAAAKKAKAEEAAAKKAAGAEARKKPSPPAKAPPKKAFSKPLQLQLSRTIALPKKKEDKNQSTPQSTASPPSTKAAPRGVPVLNRWRKNRDGSVTGLITGSSQFNENERVTTSPIAKGNISEGNVVQTQSGSKYFLS